MSHPGSPHAICEKYMSFGENSGLPAGAQKKPFRGSQHCCYKQAAGGSHRNLNVECNGVKFIPGVGPASVQPMRKGRDLWLPGMRRVRRDKQVAV